MKYILTLFSFFIVLSSFPNKSTDSPLEKEFIKESSEVKNKLNELNTKIENKSELINEKIKHSIQKLDSEISDTRRDLDEKINTKVWTFGIIIAFLGFLIPFLGKEWVKKKVKEKIDSYIEFQAKKNIELVVTDDYIKNIIAEKGDQPLKEIIQKIEKKGSETIKKFEKKGKEAIDELHKNSTTTENLIEDNSENHIISDYFDLAFNEKDHDAKISLYNKIIELQPENYSAINNRGVSYDIIQKHDLALKDFEKAAKIEPNFTLAKTNKINILIHKREFDKGIVAVNLLLKSDTKNALALSLKGILLFHKGNEETALSHLNKAIELDSHNSDIFFNRGFFHLESKSMNLNQAKLDFEKALELADENATANLYNNLAVVYRRLKDYNKAIELLDKAKIISSLNPNTYGTLALIYADQNMDKEFYTYLEIALIKGCQAWHYMNDSGFDKYRDDIRLKELIEKYKK